MDENSKEQRTQGIDRRKFLGALGAAVAAGGLLQYSKNADAQSAVYYYQDSFGNVVPAGNGAVALGVYPPALPAGPPPPTGANTTFYNTGYPKYNILMIIVDQMRNPAFWLPSGGTDWRTAFSATLPNIAQLANWSFTFPNYRVAATVCGPSRACLLTGLYSQQTCQFKSSAGVVAGGSPLTPPLLPYQQSWSAGNNNAGFPTIGNVLSQILPIGTTGNNAYYDCTWIGKWHLSCQSGVAGSIPGANGPSDYGFNPTYSLPTANTTNPYNGGGSVAYPSPNGLVNEGSGGDFLDSFTQLTPVHDMPNWAASLVNANNSYTSPVSGFSQLNDAAIAWAFINKWLPNANNNLNFVSNPGQPPWFCAVSFINPHDISDFPYPFALTSPANNNAYFGWPNNNSLPGNAYQPPPANASQTSYLGGNCHGNCTTNGDADTIAGFPSSYSSLPPGIGNNVGPWNWEDLTSGSLQYSNNGKPGLQTYYLNITNNICGTIHSPTPYNNTSNNWTNPQAWQIFLNYYMWMESCVDYQIGQVLGIPAGSNGLQQYPNFWNNTVIIFTSDHGEYGGAHGLHSKGGALYDEIMNVPLFISYPTMRNANHMIPLTYVCSSVDILPYLYSLALGNESWRNNNGDMVYYLRGRESIADAVYQYTNGTPTPLQQRRISSIPLYVPVNGCNMSNANCSPWQLYQPFVLHSADDYSVATASGSYQPSHALAFITVDQTDINNNSAPFYPKNSNGGAKLGIYSYWNTCANMHPIMGVNNNNAPNQYEFYNYSPHPSTGNLAANPQEIGNQYFDPSGNNGLSNQGQLYYDDFFNIGGPPGGNIQNEFYYLNTGSVGSNSPTMQVAQAVNNAFSNYLLYLYCAGQLTGNNNNGPVSCLSGTCPPTYLL